MGLHRSTESTLIHLVVTVVTLAAGVAAVVPVVEFWFTAVGLVLLGAGALWIVVALVRRELRIRRRLAAIRAEAPPAVAPKPWNREAA
jgi:ABC-type nickel/cobalt efflux system permease component RcnA